MQHVGVHLHRPRDFRNRNALFEPLDRGQLELPSKPPARQSHDSFSPFHGFCLLTGCLTFGGKSTDELSHDDAEWHAALAVKQVTSASLAEVAGEKQDARAVHTLVSRSMRSYEKAAPERTQALRSAAVEALG